MNSIVKIMKMKQITYKLFMTTSLILLSFAVLIYLTLYFFLPTFYEQYKTDQLQTGINEIIDKSKNLTFQDAIPLFDEYAKKNNAMLGCGHFSPTRGWRLMDVQCTGGDYTRGLARARSEKSCSIKTSALPPIWFLV